MKCTRFILPAFYGAIAALLLLSPLGAQETPAPNNSNAAPANPGGDPFVKKKGAPPAAPVAAAQDPPTMAVIQEVVALPMDAYHRLVESTMDSGQLYQAVEKLKSTGQAKLETLMEATTHSGQRVAGEQVDEVFYATQWNPPQSEDGFPFPTGYEMRPVGQKWEVDPVMSPDGQVADLSLTAPNTRLSGFQELRADARKPGVLQPTFENREITTAVTVHLNRPQLVGTMNRSVTLEGGADNMVRLLFARVMPVDVGVPAKASLPNPGGPNNMRFTVTVFSMEQATAVVMLRNAGDPEAVHAAVMEQVRGEKAKLERILSCVTRSGLRAVAREDEEYRFGTECNPPQEELERTVNGKVNVIRTGKVIPPAWTAMQTRPLGWSMEVDPVLNETGIVNLSLALERTVLLSCLRGHEWLESRDPQMPLYESRKITTSLSTALGKHSLMGTFSPPHDTNVNNQKDDGRIWLAFLAVTVD